jgi:hypothetical protein
MRTRLRGGARRTGATLSRCSQVRGGASLVRAMRTSVERAPLRTPTTRTNSQRRSSGATADPTSRRSGKRCCAAAVNATRHPPRGAAEHPRFARGTTQAATTCTKAASVRFLCGHFWASREQPVYSVRVADESALPLGNQTRGACETTRERARQQKDQPQSPPPLQTRNAAATRCRGLNSCQA